MWWYRKFMDFGVRCQIWRSGKPHAAFSARKCSFSSMNFLVPFQIWSLIKFNSKNRKIRNLSECSFAIGVLTLERSVACMDSEMLFIGNFLRKALLTNFAINRWLLWKICCTMWMAAFLSFSCGIFHGVSTLCGIQISADM